VTFVGYNGNCTVCATASRTTARVVPEKGGDGGEEGVPYWPTLTDVLRVVRCLLLAGFNDRLRPTRA